MHKTGRRKEEDPESAPLPTPACDEPQRLQVDFVELREEAGAGAPLGFNPGHLPGVGELHLGP